MKKAIYSICTVLALGLASCGGSVESNIEKLNDLKKEAKDLENDENLTRKELTVKRYQLAAERYEVLSKLAKEDLTEDQIKKINEIMEKPIFKVSDYKSGEKK